MVEGTNDGKVLVYVGHDMSTHTARAATIRVSGDGRVERQDFDESGEIFWVPDRPEQALH